MAKLVTFDDHPDMTAVFSMAGMDKRAAARATRALLLRQEFNSVVILRESGTLDQTTEAVVASIRENPVEMNSARCKELLGEAAAPGSRGMDRICGPDYAEMLDFLSDFTEKRNDIRMYKISGADGHNYLPHIDSVREGIEVPVGMEESELAQAGILPHGVVFTMAARGGGTRLFEIDAHEYLSLMLDPPLYRGTPRAAWDTPSGAIVALKSAGWFGMGHFPVVHASPPRLDDGNARERSVAVGFVPGRHAYSGPLP